MRGIWTVFRKEVVDAWRDRKSLFTMLITGVLMGPLMLMILSAVVSSAEERAERREVWVAGIEHAPDLGNHLARLGLTLKTPPEDFESSLREARFGNPVIVVPPDYLAKRAAGEAPEIRIVFDSSNKDAAMQVGTVEEWVNAYRRRLGNLELAWRGVSTEIYTPFTVQRHNLADQQSQSATLTGVVALFVLIAVLVAAVTGPLDSMAGERERGSLQPLLLNPLSLGELVTGKWLAVAAVAMTVASLSVFSFLPAQWWLQSEALQAMFRFGVTEGAMFLLMLLPFAGAASAMMMLTAIHGRTFKEAQTNGTVLMLVLQMLPILGMLNTSGEKPWHIWLPSLAQHTVMLRILRGDALEWQHLWVPTGVSLLLTVICLVVVAKRIRILAVR